MLRKFVGWLNWWCGSTVTVSCWTHLAMSWLAELWKVLGFQSVSEEKSLDIYWLTPKPPRPSTLVHLWTCTITKCFLTVSLLTIASSHSAKDRPNRSQWSVLQCFPPHCASFSVCVYVYPHFLSVSIFILIFCLSPSLSLLSVCLHLFFYFLSVSILIFIFLLSPYRDGDRQKIKIEMETDRKWGKSWRQTKNEEKVETDRK